MPGPSPSAQPDDRALRRVQQHWEDIGSMDPLWGVFTRPNGKFGGWDHEEFFATGEREIEWLTGAVEPLNRPARHELALDFGCGVGRLSRALAGRFDRVCGVDVSEAMVRQARALNADVPACEFLVNCQEDLRLLPDRHFDLAYTRWVLHHLGSRRLIKAYIAELARTVRKDGILVFQVITHIPLWRRLKLRHRAYSALRRMGLGRTFLYQRLQLIPFTATHIPEREVRELLDGIGARVLRVDPESRGRSGVQSRIFFVQP